MQAGKGVPCLISNAVASRSGCVFSLSPGQQLPALVGAQGEEPTEEEAWMDGFCSEEFLQSCWEK